MGFFQRLWKSPMGIWLRMWAGTWPGMLQVALPSYGNHRPGLCEAFLWGWYLGAFPVNKPCLSASHRSRKTVRNRCKQAMFIHVRHRPNRDFPWGTGRTPVCRGTGGLSSGGLLRAEFNLVRQERWTETPFWRIQPFLVKNWGWWNWRYHIKH